METLIPDISWQPRRDAVLVKPIIETKVGNFYLPDVSIAKQKNRVEPIYANVIAVGSDLADDIKRGDKLMILSYGGSKVTLDDTSGTPHNLQIIKLDDILGVVDAE